MRSVKKAARKLVRLVQEHYFSLFPDAELMARLDRAPAALVIETINVCNANCTFCAYQYQERRHRLMPDELFAKALGDYVAMGGGNLGLCVIVGDPLLDPKFVERVRLARAQPAVGRISTVTNCLALHRFGAAALLQSGINALTVSTTGFSPEMYQRVYRSPKYPDMRRNVLDLLRTNAELGKPVRIEIALRVDRPLDEVLSYPDFKEVLELADAVDANSYFDSWSGRIKAEDLTGTMKLRPTSFTFMKKRIPCTQLWSGLGVLVDGTVTACACRDLNGDSDLVLGNVRDTALQDLYRSSRLRQLRDDWFGGKCLPNICRDCTHYTPYSSLTLERRRARGADEGPAPAGAAPGGAGERAATAAP